MDAAELEWIAWTTPITTSFGRTVAAGDLRGRTVACRQHVLGDTISILTPLVEAGARVRVAPCNAESTDDRAAAHLASIGVEIRARSGMSTAELDDSLGWLLAEPADALCDMGGDLIAGAVGAGHSPAGALEATTTGLHRLDGLDLPFPVLDWNGIALKELIHNRHHVGVETWPAFTAITGLSLYGREVVVVGFGPVGQGVAARARDLGAVVTVVDLDPVRLVQAQHDGCRVADLDVALRTAEVVVTATGFDGVLGAQALAQVADGAVLLNVGHSDREIDVDVLDRHPRTTVRRLERVDLDDRTVYLLNRGSLVNLAPGLGINAPQLFDPFAAIMLLGLHAILDGRTTTLPNGVQRYPRELEDRVARALATGVRGR
ncbi:adenosylhomocysteinase [Oryzobacter sp. R7]|uniref:adenosylhomocysteinase n=1 Tax=Oryzobacter faecalis TaxID=3388656 RepID=UPI00398D5FB1